MTTGKNQVSASVDTGIHLLAGGLGGTTGAILTCPLEVVKTRLQSSNSGFGPAPPTWPPTPTRAPEARTTPTTAAAAPSTRTTTPPASTSHRDWRQAHAPRAKTEIRGALLRFYHRQASSSSSSTSSTSSSSASSLRPLSGGRRGPIGDVVACLRYIVETEGPRGLFRGLGPNLVGVAPSRAIYFFTYSTVKKHVNSGMPKRNRDTPFVHVVSAASAGFCASTCTNPIWLVKTRLQLDRATGEKTMTVSQCVRKIFNTNGAIGFWKGVTASYWGISETVIHFVIYESLKKRVTEYQSRPDRSSDEKSFVDFAGFMLCGACSKTCATVVAYPHEVARTRMREEGSKYRTFWGTLATVAREEGRRGLYRGLTTQLIRQIPNTAVMMATYELTVAVMTKYFKNNCAAGSGNVDDHHRMRHKSSHSQ